MIHLERSEEPEILTQKKVEWTEKYQASGKADSSKYRHKRILEALKNISNNKCFYSEFPFTHEEFEVDHHRELADGGEPYEWENLYLSHKYCNQSKKGSNNKTLKTLDPFEHSIDEILQNLTFRNEIICGKTDLGKNTINKYYLNHYFFQEQRRILLQKYQSLKIKYLEKKNSLDKINQSKFVSQLNSFAYSSQPFSLMFKDLFQEDNSNNHH